MGKTSKLISTRTENGQYKLMHLCKEYNKIVNGAILQDNS
jgi:hypothetical protein